MLSRLLARVGLTTPEQRAWAWYDCGNSAYFTTVITAIFPAFFASYAAAGMTQGEATTRFGVITTVGMAIVAIAAPVLGAYGDYTARRKRLLVACAAIGIASTFALTTIAEGGWRWAALLFVVGNVGVSGSLVFYDSMLPSVAAPEDTDRVSSAGYALGYLGGGLLLVLNLAWVLQPQWFGLSGTVAAIKLSFVSVGVWWLLFLMPLLRHVPEPPRLVAPGEQGGASAVRGAFARLAHTFAEIRQYRQAFLALLAMLVYQDGIQTIIRFAGIYGAEVGVGQSAQIAAFAMVQLLGVPFAFAFGALGGRIGTQRAIFLALGVYTVAAVLGFFMQNATHFFLLAGLVATVQGGAQALSRSLFARMIPPAKTSEYFGFYAVVERFATILGPLVFTLSGALTGSSRSAVAGMILFFVVGGWLLSRVDVAEGERAARAA
ncbi:MAG: MFS transporter [Vicinamibacterales bacterium]